MASDGDRLRATAKGTWYDRCGEMALAEHANPRCDDCRRGSKCGYDCTLSKLTCPKCGATA
jgi:hypothetical protein